MTRNTEKRSAEPRRNQRSRRNWTLTNEQLCLSVRGGTSTGSGCDAGYEDGKLKLSMSLGVALL